MAHKINAWNAESRDYFDTEDEYEVYTLTAVHEPDDTWGHASGEQIRLYRSDRTGVVTMDPHAYEASRNVTVVIK